MGLKSLIRLKIKSYKERVKLRLILKEISKQLHKSKITDITSLMSRVKNCIYHLLLICLIKK
jgi:hypothetical protein